MPLFAGFLQIVSTSLCVAVISLQLASIAGNGVFHVTVSDTAHRDVGVFNYCSVSKSGEATCTNCKTTMAMFDDAGESQRYCFGEPDKETTYGDVKGKYRGVQAIAIITFIFSLVHFGVTTAFVCDKISTPVPAFVTTLLLMVGGVTTAALAITTLNAGCEKTFCDRQKEYLNASNCVASFTIYCEIFTGAVALAGAILLYCSKRKSEKAAYPIATMPPASEVPPTDGQQYSKI